MKYKSQVYTQASGSVGGLTYSHNRGGLYTRARSIPVNPSSAQQQAIRNAMNTLMQAWESTLTQAQRDAWGVYAQNVTRPDTLGEPRMLTAANWYIACNTPRLQVGLTRIDPAPTVFAMALLTNPNVTGVVASTKVATITFTNTDPWATVVGGSLLVYSSPPQNPSVNFFKGPYRFAGRINGAATPPTSPGTVTTTFTLAAGQRVFFQLRAVNADARISSPFRVGVLAS